MFGWSHSWFVDEIIFFTILYQWLISLMHMSCLHIYLINFWLSIKKSNLIDFQRGRKKGLLENFLDFFMFTQAVSISISKLVLCYQNCSDLLWGKIDLAFQKNFWNSRLKAESFKNFEITKTIYWNSERSEEFFGNRMLFNLFLEVSHI